MTRIESNTLHKRISQILRLSFNDQFSRIITLFYLHILFILKEEVFCCLLVFFKESVDLVQKFFGLFTDQPMTSIDISDLKSREKLAHKR